MSPADMAQAMRQAVENSRTAGETHADFGMSKGSPRRFAGERLAAGYGLDGDFARMAEDKNGKKALATYMDRFGRGPMNVDLPGFSGGPADSRPESKEVA